MISFEDFFMQEECDKYNMLQECNAYIKSKDREIKWLENQLQQKENIIKGLNNIINEFDKWLDEESEKTILSTGHLTCLIMCKNELQELKGGDEG